MSSTAYDCETLPLAGIEPGTTLLVTGRSSARARAFALQLFAEVGSEAVVLVTTSARASDIVRECRRAGLPVDRDRTIIVDCTGKRAWFSSARVERVSGPSNVGGIGFQISRGSQAVGGSDVASVGVGVFSLSDLLAAADLKTVSRFVNSATGRIRRTGGLGVLAVDTGAHDSRTVETIEAFCGARIALRGTDGRPELRATGLDQPEEWTAYRPASE